MAIDQIDGLTVDLQPGADVDESTPRTVGEHLARPTERANVVGTDRAA
jgi:hypothetical protein